MRNRGSGAAVGVARQAFAERLRTEVKGKRAENGARQNERGLRGTAEADRCGEANSQSKGYAAGENDDALKAAKVGAADTDGRLFALTKNGGEIVSDGHQPSPRGPHVSGRSTTALRR